MRQSSYNVRRNNWPPLPEQCCFQPCFYQDIQVDIPLEFQKIVRHLYYLWICIANLDTYIPDNEILSCSHFSPRHCHAAKYIRRNTCGRFYGYLLGNNIHLAVHAVFLLVLVSSGLQGVPFGLLVQLYGVFLHILFPVYNNRCASHRGSWLWLYVSGDQFLQLIWINRIVLSGMFTALAKFRGGSGADIIIAIFELLIACGFACAAAADLFLISKVICMFVQPRSILVDRNVLDSPHIPQHWSKFC